LTVPIRAAEKLLFVRNRVGSSLAIRQPRIRIDWIAASALAKSPGSSARLAPLPNSLPATKEKNT
jgi:hypothetical protein